MRLVVPVSYQTSIKDVSGPQDVRGAGRRLSSGYRAGMRDPVLVDHVLTDPVWIGRYRVIEVPDAWADAVVFEIDGFADWDWDPYRPCSCLCVETPIFTPVFSRDIHIADGVRAGLDLEAVRARAMEVMPEIVWLPEPPKKKAPALGPVPATSASSGRGKRKAGN